MTMKDFVAVGGTVRMALVVVVAFSKQNSYTKKQSVVHPHRLHTDEE